MRENNAMEKEFWKEILEKF